MTTPAAIPGMQGQVQFAADVLRRGVPMKQLSTSRRANRTVARLIATCLIGASAIAGCGTSGGSTAHSTKLNVGIVVDEASSTDPTASDMGNSYLGALLHDTLMKIVPTGQVEPNLFESVSHPSPTSYIY